MNTTKQADYVRTALRLPPELHKAVHELATQEERTFNGQIVACLRQLVASRSQIHCELAKR
ncbi:MAG: hypothetical protein K1X48_02245 [Burkholderiaceae bacterium]|nr:hypothetical protein [Burkholderiaceae bacterium]